MSSSGESHSPQLFPSLPLSHLESILHSASSRGKCRTLLLTSQACWGLFSDTPLSNYLMDPTHPSFLQKPLLPLQAAYPTPSSQGTAHSFPRCSVQ